LLENFKRYITNANNGIINNEVEVRQNVEFLCTYLEISDIGDLSNDRIMTQFCFTISDLLLCLFGPRIPDYGSARTKIFGSLRVSTSVNYAFSCLFQLLHNEVFMECFKFYLCCTLCSLEKFSIFKTSLCELYQNNLDKGCFMFDLVFWALEQYEYVMTNLHLVHNIDISRFREIYIDGEPKQDLPVEESEQDLPVEEIACYGDGDEDEGPVYVCPYDDEMPILIVHDEEEEKEKEKEEEEEMHEPLKAGQETDLT
jgi:hypothetical protein